VIGLARLMSHEATASAGLYGRGYMAWGEFKGKAHRAPLLRIPRDVHVGCSFGPRGFLGGREGTIERSLPPVRVRYFASAFAFALRALKCASVSFTCFGVSAQDVFFASAGRVYVERKCARTTFPLIPSFEAICSGRVICSVFAIRCHLLHSFVRSYTKHSIRSIGHAFVRSNVYTIITYAVGRVGWHNAARGVRDALASTWPPLLPHRWASWVRSANSRAQRVDRMIFSHVEAAGVVA
jgi:hypothetical protein